MEALTGWLAEFEAWMDAEPWRWIAAGVLEAAVWGAGIFLIWRRSVEARARELAKPPEPLVRFSAHLDDRASGALARMGKLFRSVGRDTLAASARATAAEARTKELPPPTHPNCRSTGDRDAQKREWAASVVRGIAAFAPTAGHAIAGIRQAFGFSGKLDRLSDPIDVHTLDGEDLQFRVNLDVDPEDVRRAVDEWTVATPAHPNYRSETPQADELERLIDEIRTEDLREGQRRPAWAVAIDARIRAEMARKRRAESGLFPQKSPGLGDIDVGFHEQGRSNVPARPFLRPALEGVDIHERAKRARANMVEACEVIGVNARQAGEALAYLGRAMKDTGASMEVQRETTNEPKYALKIQGGEWIAVLMFADTKELRWFAEVYRSAKTQNLATNIEIALAWSKFRQLHEAHPAFGLPGWLGGVVAERRDAPDVIRFRCGTYAFREWGLTTDSGGTQAPDHGGKCPACAEADTDLQAPQIRFSAHAIADMARAAADDGVDYDERMEKATAKIEDMVREHETRG